MAKFNKIVLLACTLMLVVWYASSAIGAQEMELYGNVAVNDTYVTVVAKAKGIIADGGWIVIDPYTDECEVRKITGINGEILSFDDGLDYAHSDGGLVYWSAESIVNVKWFGATGNGTTNDYQSIQRAIDSLYPIGGKVDIPSGVYNIGTSSLLLDGDILLLGDGLSTTIQYTGTSAALKINTGKGIACQGVKVKRLRFDGNDTGKIGILLGNSDLSPYSAGGILEQVSVTRFVDYGIKSICSQYLVMRGVGVKQCGVGILFEHTPGLYNVAAHLYDCTFLYNTKQGVYIKNLYSSSFVGCHFSDNGEEGVYLERSVSYIPTGISFLNCYIQNNNASRNNGYYQFYAEQTSGQFFRNINVRYCHFHGAGIGNKHVGLEFLQKGSSWAHNYYTSPDTNYGTLERYNEMTMEGEDPSNWAIGPNNKVFFGGKQIDYVIAFGSSDTTPSVANGRLFKTNNFNAATIIRDFDEGFVGQEITVLIGDDNTTVDFTAGNLKGNGGSDWSPSQGDNMTCIYDGLNWYCDVNTNR